MRNLVLIIFNILKTTFRKKGNIIIYVFLPLAGVLLSLLIFGGTSSSQIRVGFTNNDNGALSAKVRNVLESKNGFIVHDVMDDEINDKLTNQSLDLVVTLPDGFTEGVYSGDIKEIEIITIKGQETTAWIKQLLNSYLGVLEKLSVASEGNKALFDKMYEQYEETSIHLNVASLEDKQVGKLMTLNAIGFLIMFMMLGTSFTSFVILNEKRSRTFYRICTAPVNSRQYILANAMTSVLIIIIQIILIQFAMKSVFRINTGVSSPAMFIILLMFGLVAIGIGLAITAFSSSSYIAGSLSTLIMTPTCMLGGCFWDIELMPEFMQKISYFMPQRWVIEAVKKLQNNGDFSEIYLNLLVLAAFALALVLVAVYKFSKTDNLQKFV